ncbi:MAG TPA: response regulator transcription factor [Stellaceae bacterium]|nr:response regulator transcription factor [Stellaceae bacterium]
MSALDGKRILIVDDAQFVRKTIKRMLQMVGRPVIEEAADGDAALKTLETFMPEVVLCDIHMKPMNGFAFVRHLRQLKNPELCTTPVVMLTTDQAQGTVAHARGLGVHGYLLKPVSPHDLEQRLGGVLRNRAASWSAQPAAPAAEKAPRA